MSEPSILLMNTLLNTSEPFMVDDASYSLISTIEALFATKNMRPNQRKILLLGCMSIICHGFQDNPRTCDLVAPALSQLETILTLKNKVGHDGEAVNGFYRSTGLAVPKSLMLPMIPAIRERLKTRRIEE